MSGGEWRPESPIAVVGAAGGVGTTLVAMGLALAAQRSVGPVRLVDLDLGRGDIADAWNLAGRRSVVDLSPVIDELDSGHLARASRRHRSGVDVLAAPATSEAVGRLGPAESRALAAVLAAERAVVDVGCPASAGVAFLRAAGAVLLVCPANLRAAGWASSLLGGLGGDARVGLVWVRGPHRPEVGARALSRLLGVRLAASLPWSPREAAVIASGRVPGQRRAPLARSLTALAGALW